MKGKPVTSALTARCLNGKTKCLFVSPEVVNSSTSTVHLMGLPEPNSAHPPTFTHRTNSHSVGAGAHGPLAFILPLPLTLLPFMTPIAL